MPEDTLAPSNEPVSSTPTPPQAPQPPMPPEPAAPHFSSMPGSMPAQSQPVVSAHHAASGSRFPKLKFKKPFVVAGAAVAAAVLVGGGLVFGLYLPNTPENVYSAGLENTGKAVDRLIQYSKDQQKVDYKSADVDGTFKLKSPQGSFDFDLNGSGDEDGNLTATMNLDLMGNKGNANIRSVHIKGDTSPDVYFQFNGIKKYLDSNGMDSLDNLDGQWTSVDHTLIDTYSSQIKDMSPGGVDPSDAPTAAQLQDAEVKVQTVNKQYLYTTNNSKAVLANEKYLGQTTENGRAVNHYRVGYNKDHLTAYVKAVATALDSSTLNDWSKTANKGKSLSEAADFTQLESEISGYKADYTFELWVDTGTKLVSKVAFTDTDPADKNGVFTIGQNYTGGDEYPFTFTVNDKDSSGNPEQFTMNMNVNTKTNKVSFSMDGNMKDDSGTTTLSLTLNVVPSKQSITVTAPAGAKSVNELLNELGLGGLTTGLPDNSSSADMPLFFQQ